VYAVVRCLERFSATLSHRSPEAMFPWSTPAASIIREHPPPELGGCAPRSSCTSLYLNPLQENEAVSHKILLIF
jgi:hypothetical protein